MVRPSTVVITRRCKVAGLFMLLFGFGSCRPFFHREVGGKILDLQSSATGTISGRQNPLTSKGFIWPGETISSAPGGRLDLALLPGILVELVGDTEIEITELKLARDGDETIRPMTVREAKIQFRRGTLIASVGEAQTDPRLIVGIPDATLVAEADSTFEATLTGGKTRILSVRRQLTVLATVGPSNLKIPAGYFADLPMSQAAPQAVAKAGPEMQAELGRIFVVEKRLLKLDDEHRADFKPW